MVNLAALATLRIGLMLRPTPAWRGMPRLAQVVHPRTCVTKAQFDAFGEAGPQPPSEKQVAYAQRLAMQMATPLPEQALTNRQQCSDFIESMLEKAPASEKQLEFANSLAAKAGMSVPEHAKQSSAAISKFIEGFGGGSRQGGTAAATDPNMPTEKQLAFAVKLARERRLGLSAEVLADKSACVRRGPNARPSRRPSLA